MSNDLYISDQFFCTWICMKTKIFFIYTEKKKKSGLSSISLGKNRLTFQYSSTTIYLLVWG